MQNSKNIFNHHKTYSIIESSENKQIHQAVSILEEVFTTFRPFEEKYHKEKLNEVVAEAKAPLQRLKLPLKSFHNSFFREEEVERKSVISIKKATSTHCLERLKKPSSLISNCKKFKKLPEKFEDVETDGVNKIKERRRKEVIEIKKNKDSKPKVMKIEKTNLLLYHKGKQIALKNKTEHNIFYGFDGKKGQVNFQDTFQIKNPSINLSSSLGKIKDFELKPVKAKKENWLRMSLENTNFDNTYMLPNYEGNKYHIVDEQLQSQFTEIREVFLKIKEND